MTMLWVWLVVAIAAALGEAVTYDLFLASVCGAALITAAVAGVVGLPFQIAVFSVLSLVGIFVVRPAVKRALKIDSASDHPALGRNVHLVNRRAVVTQTVTADGGQIRVGQGEFWTARAMEPEDHLEAGQPARIVMIDGLTAVVEPVTGELEPSSSSLPGTNSEKGT